MGAAVREVYEGHGVVGTWDGPGGRPKVEAEMVGAGISKV